MLQNKGVGRAARDHAEKFFILKKITITISQSLFVNKLILEQRYHHSFEHCCIYDTPRPKRPSYRVIDNFDDLGKALCKATRTFGVKAALTIHNFVKVTQHRLFVAIPCLEQRKEPEN